MYCCAVASSYVPYLFGLSTAFLSVRDMDLPPPLHRCTTRASIQPDSTPPIFFLTGPGSIQNIWYPVLHLAVMCRVNFETLEKSWPTQWCLLCEEVGFSRECLFIFAFFSSADIFVIFLSFLARSGVVSRARLQNTCKDPAYYISLNLVQGSLVNNDA